MSQNKPSFKLFNKTKTIISNNNQPISAKKADKLARKIAKEDALKLINKTIKKSYWNWQRLVMVTIAFVIIFGFVIQTIAPISFR